MHSFASVLIAAALATLITAAPLALPYNFLASRSFVREASVWPVYARTGSSTGQVGSAESQVESVPNGVRVRGVDSAIAGAVRSTRSEITQVHARADPPSVASIFAFLSNEIQPYTVQLTYLDSSSLTVPLVTDIVASVKTPIVNAVSELEALVGLDASVILAPVTGNADLTVPEMAAIVSENIHSIFSAAGHVLNVRVEADIAAEVKAIVEDLDGTVIGLAYAVKDIVNGLAPSLAPSLIVAESALKT